MLNRWPTIRHWAHTRPSQQWHQNYILIYSFSTIAFAILLHSFCVASFRSMQCTSTTTIFYRVISIHFTQNFATKRIIFGKTKTSSGCSLSGSMEVVGRFAKTKSISKMICNFSFLFLFSNSNVCLRHLGHCNG